MPELGLCPCETVHIQIGCIVDGDRDRSSGLIAVVAVFIVPHLAYS